MVYAHLSFNKSVKASNQFSVDFIHQSNEKNIMIQAFWFHLCSPGPPKGIPGDHHTSIVRADCYIVTLKKEMSCQLINRLRFFPCRAHFFVQERRRC
jgi:hypothetical protein